MNTDEFTKKVQEALGENLVSVIVFGSSATDETRSRYSDTNTLIVSKKLGMSELKRLASAIKHWGRQGNPPPLLFTRNRFLESVDVFPIEYLDMQERHRVLYGEDMLADIEVDIRHLRYQLEHELKGKLLHLRDAYITTDGKPKRVAEILTRSYSTLQILFRAALRLYDRNQEVSKSQAISILSERIDFDAAAFAKMESLKMGETSIKEVDCDALFESILDSVSKVADEINALAD